MSRPPSSRGLPFAAILGAACVVSGARAGLIGAKDGWFGSGPLDIAATSASRHFLGGLVPAFVGATALALWLLTSEGRARHVASLAGVALAWLFVAGRWPSMPYHAPGFDGARAIAAHLGAIVSGGTAAFLIARRARGPAIVLGSATLVLAALSIQAWRSLSSPRKPARPNVIVISLDTVRRDRLGCYGNARALTPEIDRFAQRATRFEHAYCPEAWTLTSHMTLLTSLNPRAHGVDGHAPLPIAARTLAQEMTDGGYVTAAQVDDVGWLHPWFGFDRGFRTYRRVKGGAGRKDRALAPLLDDLATGKPFFLLLHYFDAHGDWGKQPYEAPPDDEAEFAKDCGGFDGCDAKGRCGVGLLRAWNEEGATPPEDVRRCIAEMYDAGVHALDRELGALFRELERRGLLESSIVVLVADHGEEFFEHGKALHHQLYEECTAVPMLVHLPGQKNARTVAPVVGLVDVAPTLLDLVGLVPARGMQGQSLERLLVADAGTNGATTLARPYVVMESGEELCALRTDSRLLVGVKESWRLFDVVADPGELHDLLADGTSSEAEELKSKLAAELALEAETCTKLGLRRVQGGLPPAELERLRGIGYVGDGR